MCSYKAWIWFTAIYSIPLILVLILCDVVSLIGLNAPHLLKYDLMNHSQISVSTNFQNENHQNDEAFFDEPKLGEAAAQRMPYERQFRSDFDENNNNLIEDTTEDQKNPELRTLGLLKEIKDVSTNEPKEDNNNSQLDKITDDNISNGEVTKIPATTLKDESIDKGKDEKETNGKDKLDENDKKNDDDKKEENLEDKDKKDDNTNKDDKGKPLDEKTEDENQNDSKEKIPDSQASKELNRNEILKRSWNEFLDGLYSKSNSSNSKLVLNVFVFIKLGFRILSLITLPLLIIGNQTSRTTYIKPFKMILLLQFLSSIAITIYYAIISTEVRTKQNLKKMKLKYFRIKKFYNLHF